MCCEECSRYEICEDSNRLKDDCCPECQEYYDCVGMDDREDREEDPFRDSDNKDYF